jgi:uncharacterized cupredoxin-like copper-binding protein
LLQPGEHYDLVFRSLTVGTYQLWCGVPSHRALGMAGVLIVKR